MIGFGRRGASERDAVDLPHAIPPVIATAGIGSDQDRIDRSVGVASRHFWLSEVRNRSTEGGLVLKTFGWVHGLSRSVDESHCDKNHEVLFDVLLDLRLEETTDDRNAFQDGRPIFDLLDVFADESAEGDGVSVHDGYGGFHLTDREDGLVHDVVGQGDCDGIRAADADVDGAGCDGLDRAAVVNKPFELGDFRLEFHVHGEVICLDLRLDDLEDHSRVAGFKVFRVCWGHRGTEGTLCGLVVDACSAATTADATADGTRDLGWSEGGRVTELAGDLDAGGGPVPARDTG